MDTEKLHDLVKRYEDNREYITNEETAKLALVVPFVRAMGYDPNNPREVRLEFTAEFAQGDGKRLADRMDFAIFDTGGTRPLMVIETKPLGTDLQASSKQLARYVSQLSELHFGIMTDGCHYIFFGDLDAPNQMDREPFFTFSLDDPSTDWSKVAKFLAKFSRDAFNAETLITEAEDSRYRQAMIEKLIDTLRKPADDIGFMNWLTQDLYKGKRTSGVMTRLGGIAKESIEPAMLRLMTGDFLEKLRDRMSNLEPIEVESAATIQRDDSQDSISPEDGNRSKAGIVTTEEELEFHRIVSDICSQVGYSKDDVLWKDTRSYFNVSYVRPTKWFVRFFATGDKRSIVTYVPTTTAREMAPGFVVEDAPSNFGNSRISLDTIEQVWALRELIVQSLKLVAEGKVNPALSDEDGASPAIDTVS